MDLSLTKLVLLVGLIDNSLDGMHAIFSLLENKGAVFLEDLISNLKFTVAVFVIDVLANAGIEVMKGRQTVHDN